jgi:hypothetical protein
VPHPTPRALRRTFILLGVGLFSILALACSQSTSHPPVSGDCVGDDCPPSQPRRAVPPAEGRPDTGTGTPDVNVPDAIGPDDSGNFPDVNVFPDVGVD